MGLQRLDVHRRYHPVRMICAKPSASFWSVLSICILRAARACRASRHTTSRDRRRSSCTSDGVIEPVSTSMRASSPACWRTAFSISLGTERHCPRQSLWPASSTMQIAVILWDSVQSDIAGHRATSHDANHRRQRPDRGTIGGIAPPRLPDVHTWHTCPGLRQSGSGHRRLCHACVGPEKRTCFRMRRSSWGLPVTSKPPLATPPEWHGAA